MHQMTRRRGGQRTGRGMALPTVLLVLVVLTLLGVAAVFTASTDLSIAGNARGDLHALSVAEAGIHEAFARLNVKTGAPPDWIVPEVDGGGNPVSGWSLTIVNEPAPGAGEAQTLSGVYGTPSGLPIRTTVQYKKESVEEPVSHCNGTCDASEVVRFHEDYDYAGTNVPKPPRVGPPVLQIVSTYEDQGASKTVLVEAVRSLTQAKTPGTVRACGAVNCGGSNTTDGSSAPGTVAIVAGTTSSGCSTHVEPPTAVVQTGQTCPADLFSDTFGMTKNDMKGIADILGTAPYATPPNGTRGKIIYITGGAESTWQSNPVIGTPEEPVIVVFEGDFRVQGTVEIYGVIYVVGNMTIGAGTPKIHGAIISEGPTIDLSLTGNSTFTYDPTVLDNLNRLSPFTAILWKYQ